MPKVYLSELELEYLKDTIADAIEEIKSLHENNYYVRELQDCIDLLARDEEIEE